jgi:hypothetical protein
VAGGQRPQHVYQKQTNPKNLSSDAALVDPLRSLTQDQIANPFALARTHQLQPPPQLPQIRLDPTWYGVTDSAFSGLAPRLFSVCFGMIKYHQCSFSLKDGESNRFPRFNKFFLVIAERIRGSEGTQTAPCQGSQFFRCEAPFLLRHETECRITPSPLAQKPWTPPCYKLLCRLIRRTIARPLTATQCRRNLFGLRRLQKS